MRTVPTETLLARIAAVSTVQIGLGAAAVFLAAVLAYGTPGAAVPAEERPSFAAILDGMTLEVCDFRRPVPHASGPQGHLHTTGAESGTAPAPDAVLPAPPDDDWARYTYRWAGLLVFLIGLLAVLEHTGEAAWARFWPFLLLVLAGFLLNQSAAEAWPRAGVGALDRLADFEVLRNRLIVLCLALAAAAEWGQRAGMLAPGRAVRLAGLAVAAAATLALAVEPAAAPDRAGMERTLVEATLAGAGLLAGWSRWLEGALPGPSAAVLGRVWPWTTVAIGLGLLLYRPL